MKIGLVLEGGASRTLFSCGVMDGLLKENIMADYIIGVSAGIAFGVSYASRQRGRNLLIARKYMGDSRYMGARHLFSPKNRAYYNLDFVFDEIPNKLIPYNYKNFREFQGRCVAVVTNVETGEAEYLDVPASDTKWTLLRASCALPLLFPKIEVDGKFYMDGGVSDSIPFEQAFRDGCDKVIVVLTRERGYVKQPEKASRAAELVYRDKSGFVEAMKTRAERYNDCIKRLEEAEAQGKALVIAPEKPLGVSRVEGDPRVLETIYVRGLKLTRRLMPEIKEFISEEEK